MMTMRDATVPTVDAALAYCASNRWRKIRPASLQALDVLADEVERLRDELAGLRGRPAETPDNYAGKEDGA